MREHRRRDRRPARGKTSGLSQAHFGSAFTTSSNDKLHFAPRAVMNAGSTGVQQTIDQSDNGGHCSIRTSWPNN